MTRPHFGHGQIWPSTIEYRTRRAAAPTTGMRPKLERLESIVAQMPQQEMLLRHWFSRGVYGRDLTIPAGTIIFGRVHKFSQISVLLSGEMSLVTESGIVRLTAPAVIEAPAGTKRAAYTHTEARWITFCGVDHDDPAPDPDSLVHQLTAGTYAEYEAHCAALTAGETKCLSQQ